MQKNYRIVVQTLLLLVILTPSVHAEWFKYHESIMTTRIYVEFWADNKSKADTCAKKIMEEMHRIDAEMSPYRKDSLLYKVNMEAFQHPVKITPELYSILEKSIKVSELSKGAFDITFASIGFKYDYRNSKIPSEKEIASLLPAINFRNIVLDEESRTVYFTHNNVKIDLGGIAKGYAVDNGIHILKSCDIKHGLVTAGGDSRVIGDRRGRPWMIGIKQPRKADGVVTVLPLIDEAFSTSGDYERYFIKDGVRYHHIINPKDGKSAKAVMSVTIIGKDSVTTDSLSTTIFVMGPQRGLALVESIADTDAVIIDAQGKMFFSSGLEPAKSTKH